MCTHVCVCLCVSVCNWPEQSVRATGAHLETRVLALLKKMQTATQMPPVGQAKSKQSRLTTTFGAKGASLITPTFTVSHMVQRVPQWFAGDG